MIFLLCSGFFFLKYPKKKEKKKERLDISFSKEPDFRSPPNPEAEAVWCRERKAGWGPRRPGALAPPRRCAEIPAKCFILFHSNTDSYNSFSQESY